MKTIRTTCSYCSVGCNFDVELDDGGTVTQYRPSPSYPVNRGRSCPKGFNLLVPFEADDRLTRPLGRDTSGNLIPISWDEAARRFVDRFRTTLERYGPESAAFISTGQMPTEEMALLGAFAKFGMGLIHGDGNTRQCMATAAVAYKQAFGFDAPPFTYTDVEESDLLIFVGANPAIAHPVLWHRVKKNRDRKTVIVIDPRRTKTAHAADIHLPIQPKGDLQLLYAVAHVLIEREWIDAPFVRNHTSGLKEYAVHVRRFDPETVAPAVGLSVAALYDLAERIHRAKAVSVWWTMGVNQSHQGVRTAQGIINLCLLTGNIGRPGTGPNSITGQANAMGSRLFSNTTGLFAGYDFQKPEDRAHIADLMGIDVARVPSKNGAPYHKILEKIEEGTVRALWIIATNPAHSWIGKTHQLLERLKRLDFLVVQDLYRTAETVELADLVLPAAGSGEKEGTFINSERRIGVVQKVLDPPGEARSDFEIFKLLAEAWGCGDLFARWRRPEDVFRFLVTTTKGRPCDITGIEGYDALRESEGIQWPFPDHDRDEGVHRRLFTDGRFFNPDGRARILFSDIEEVPEPVDERYPFVLLTGRGTAVQWHTQTRTGKVPELRRHYPEEVYAEVHATDAANLALRDGDRVRISSRRGTVTARCRVTDTVGPGRIFLPMHYRETNVLTFPAFDPYSAEPSYKWAAVALRRVDGDESP